MMMNPEILSIEETGIYHSPSETVRIAIQGCSHGCIEQIYNLLEEQQKTLMNRRNKKDYEKQIDLLICCGDFQSLRNTSDYQTISVPQKYRQMGSFYKYYSGELVAPIMTIFIGGNHEASSYLQELYYGGWVAPNMYYLGASGVIRFRGLRIAGISGIYKLWDYKRGRYEMPPYNDKTVRSVYHVRNVEVARLKCLANQSQQTKTNQALADIMISHDWPRGIEQHGNVRALLKKKKFFADEVRSNTLGSPCNEELLKLLKPTYWFAAHLHVKFKANYKHSIDNDSCKTVKESNSINAAKSLLLKPSCLITSENSDVTKEEVVDEKKQPVTNEETTTKYDLDMIEDDFIALPKNETSTSFIALESSSKQCIQGQEGMTNLDLTDLMTQFLSLDKCLPRKRHLQIVNVPCPQYKGINSNGNENNNTIQSNISTNIAMNDESTSNTNNHNSCLPSLHYDLEWLAILQKTNTWTSPYNSMVPEPDIESINITKEDMDAIRNKLKAKYHNNNNSNLNTFDNDDDITKIPNNFQLSLQPHGSIGSSDHIVNGGCMVGNTQTDELLDLLGLDHIITVPFIFGSSVSSVPSNPPPTVRSDVSHDSNEIDIDNIDDEEDYEPGATCSVKKGHFIDSNEIDIDNLDEDEDDEEQLDGKEINTTQQNVMDIKRK